MEIACGVNVDKHHTTMTNLGNQLREMLQRGEKPSAVLLGLKARDYRTERNTGHESSTNATWGSCWSKADIEKYDPIDPVHIFHFPSPFAHVVIR